MTEGIKIPSRQEANQWINELSAKSGKVLEEIQHKVTRRKERRTVGAFLKRTKFLPVLLVMGAIVAIVAVTRSRQAANYPMRDDLDAPLDSDWNAHQPSL
ncbi:hypothetical protein TFLX_04619 [Thermoflexales bacterium]|nr:hypothetical protein TFLX_04619 [Thermoflexales bacterium]